MTWPLELSFRSAVNKTEERTDGRPAPAGPPRLNCVAPNKVLGATQFSRGGPAGAGRPSVLSSVLLTADRNESSSGQVIAMMLTTNSRHGYNLAAYMCTRVAP